MYKANQWWTRRYSTCTECRELIALKYHVKDINRLKWIHTGGRADHAPKPKPWGK